MGCMVDCVIISEIKADDCESLLVREPVLSPVPVCPCDESRKLQSYLPNVAKFFHSAPYFNTARYTVSQLSSVAFAVLVALTVFKHASVQQKAGCQS